MEVEAGRASEAPKISAALFAVRPGGLELDTVMELPGTFKQQPAKLSAPDTAWRLEDLRGATLAEGTFELPHVCDCGEAEDHVSGCRRRSHVAVFRLDLPRLAVSSRLVVATKSGQLVGTWDLGVPR